MKCTKLVSQTLEMTWW